jgi:thiol-disulfide isomerase/thioredoxin
VWTGIAEDPGLGVRLLLATLTGALTVPLGFLVASAAVMWLASGERRDLGRAFDLGCVAVLPFLAITLAGRAIAFALQLRIPRLAVVILTGAAFAWAGMIVALAMVRARPRGPGSGRLAGRVLVGLVAIGVIGQVVHIARYPEGVRPMQNGDPAPLFALPRVGPDGSLGAPVALAALSGKVVVLDFWATWCAPCLASMPRLDAYAKQHPEVTVLAINTDDPREARAIFSEKRYGLELLEDAEGIVGRDYRVETIPHTVVIDPQGRIRAVLHGGAHDLASVVEKIGK